MVPETHSKSSAGPLVDYNVLRQNLDPFVLVRTPHCCEYSFCQSCDAKYVHAEGALTNPETSGRYKNPLFR